MRLSPCLLVVPLLLLAAGCGGGDPLPAGGSDTRPGPAASPTPTPTPAPTPGPSPSPTPRPTPEPRRSIRLVGLGHPPPAPPLGGRIEVEAIVRTDVPDRVEFFVDGGFVNADVRWPYMLGGGRYDTRRLADGRHSLLARAVFPDGTSLEVTQPFWVENDRRRQSARAVEERVEVLVEDGGNDLAFALEAGAVTPHQWVVGGRDFGRGCADAPDLVIEPDVAVEEDRVVGEVRFSGRADDCEAGTGAVAVDAPLAR